MLGRRNAKRARPTPGDDSAPIQPTVAPVAGAADGAPAGAAIQAEVTAVDGTHVTLPPLPGPGEGLTPLEMMERFDSFLDGVVDTIFPTLSESFDDDPTRPSDEVLRRAIRRLAFHVMVGAIMGDGPDGAAQRGLSAADLEAGTTRRKCSDTDRGEMCTVCQTALKRGVYTRVVDSCGHVFHQKCAEGWFDGHDTCPVCRVGVRAPAAPAPEATEAAAP